jgi:hypothetical protein
MRDIRKERIKEREEDKTDERDRKNNAAQLSGLFYVMENSGMRGRVVWYKSTNISEKRTVCDYYLLCSACFSSLKMKAVHFSETLTNFYPTTRHSIPIDFTHHSHRCEKLKPHKDVLFYNAYLWTK